MLNMAGEAVGDIELKDEIFGIEINEFAVHEVIKNYLANQRQGTQSAKTRGEVRGGGRKPFRQKGTGRGRQGSLTFQATSAAVSYSRRSREITAIRFLRRLRDWRSSPPLSSKVKESEIIVIDSLEFSEPKTKEMIKVLANVKAAKKALIVTAEKNENVVRSAANIPGVKTSIVSAMNTYEIVNATSFIVTKDAVEKNPGGVFIMKTPYDVIIKPVISEKSMDDAAMRKIHLRLPLTQTRQK